MKKTIYILMCVTCLFGCGNNDMEELERKTVAVNIGIDMARELEGEPGTRGTTDPVDRTEHDIRYILEAWTSEGERALRTIVTRENMESAVIFNIRLVPGAYDFLCWADIVPPATNSDVCYATESLKAVRVKGGYSGADVNRDAFAWRGEAVFSSEFSLQARLVRPFAKLKIENKSTCNEVKTVALTFGTGDFIDTYNVLTGEASSSGNAVQITYPFTGSSTCDLTWDYLFVPVSGTISFQVTVGEKSKQVDNIPLKKNTVTRVVGEFVN